MFLHMPTCHHDTAVKVDATSALILHYHVSVDHLFTDLFSGQSVHAKIVSSQEAHVFIIADTFHELELFRVLEENSVSCQYNVAHDSIHIAVFIRDGHSHCIADFHKFCIFIENGEVEGL